MVRESLLMADRRELPEHSPEAEPVLILVEGDAVEFALDDGLSLTFSRGDLDDALGGSAAQDPETGA